MIHRPGIETGDRRNVGDISRPHLVDTFDDQTSQQVEIDAMCRCWPAGMRALVDGLESRHSHQALHPLAIDQMDCSIIANFPSVLLLPMRNAKDKCARLHGVIRGREAAALAAAGAALDSIGVADFAFVVWQLLVPFSITVAFFL